MVKCGICLRKRFVLLLSNRLIQTVFVIFILISFVCLFLMFKEICSANAQEPGRTNGGANCNAMLKALYDVKGHESDNVLEDNYMDPDNIFNDDDAASMSTYKPSFDVLSMGNSVLDLNTTWSSLLYKMKDEILGVGFSQVPIITSSRKLDLNQPFSLTNPKKFDRAKNKKLSLLIGCNYDNFSGSNLKACHDDIRSIKDYIVNVHNFSDDEKYMTILLDDDKHTPPTHKNIAKAFESLASKSQRGDAVFIQFSGHGGRVCSDKSTEEGYDEVLLSNDSSMKGLVQDTLIFKTLLIPMKEGVTVTMVIDCCNTGAILDLPYSWSTRDDSDIFPKVRFFYWLYYLLFYPIMCTQHFPFFATFCALVYVIDIIK